MRWQPILAWFAIMAAAAWLFNCAATPDPLVGGGNGNCHNNRGQQANGCPAQPTATSNVATATPFAHVPIYINSGGPVKTTLAFANVDPATMNKFVTYAQDQPATSVDNAGLFCTDVNPGCFSGAYLRMKNDNDFQNALGEGGTRCSGPKFDTSIFSAMANSEGGLTNDNIIYHGNTNATAPPVANAASRMKTLQSCPSPSPSSPPVNYNYQLNMGAALLQSISSSYLQGNLGVNGTWATFGVNSGSCSGCAFVWASTPSPTTAPTAIPGPLATSNPSGGGCNYHTGVEGPWDCYYIYESDNTMAAYQSGQSQAFTNSIESDPTPLPRATFYAATNTYPGLEADIKNFESNTVRASGDGVTRGGVHWQDNYAGVNFNKTTQTCNPNQMSVANAQIGELEDPIFDTKNGIVRQDTLFVSLNCAIGIETARAGAQVLWYNHVSAAGNPTACNDYATRAWHYGAFMLVWQPDPTAPGGADDIIMADGSCTGANDPAIYPEMYLWPGQPVLALQAMTPSTQQTNGSGCTNGGVVDGSIDGGITEFGAFQASFGVKKDGVAADICTSPYSIGGSVYVREFNQCAFNWGTFNTFFKCAVVFNATGQSYTGACFMAGGCTANGHTYDFSAMLSQSYSKYCDFSTACLAGAEITMPCTGGAPCVSGGISYTGNGSPNGTFCGGSAANFGALPSTGCPAWGSSSVLPALVKTTTTGTATAGGNTVQVSSCAGMGASGTGELVQIGGSPASDTTEFVTVASCNAPTLTISGTFANNHAIGVNVISAPVWILFGT